MKRAWKILAVIAVLLVAVVVAGVAVLKSMDFNEYRGLIAEQVKAATGRDLTIAGDLRLDISLTPAVAVEGVTFANAAWGSRPEMVTLRRLEVQVELLPLLTGDVRVTRVVLIGLDALLDGMSRMDFTMRFTFSHPDLHTTIVGTVNPDHLRANIDALRAGPLPADVYEEAKRRLAAAGSAPA